GGGEGGGGGGGEGGGGQGGVDAGGAQAEVRDQVAAEPGVDLDDLRAVRGELQLGVGHAVGEAQRGVRVLEDPQQLRIAQQRILRVHHVADLLEVRRVADLLAGHEHRQHLPGVYRRVDADLRSGQVLLDEHHDLVVPRPGYRRV